MAFSHWRNVSRLMLMGWVPRSQDTYFKLDGEAFCRKMLNARGRDVQKSSSEWELLKKQTGGRPG